MMSIRRRIILFLIGTLFVVNIVAGGYIYHHTRSEIVEIFDAEQAQVARIIDQLISETSISDGHSVSISSVPDIQGSQFTQLGHEYERKIAYQVWDLEGNLLLMSENAPYHPLATTASGFSKTEYEGKTWHIFSLYSNSEKKWIFTAQLGETREELIELITVDQLVSMFVVNVLVLVVVVSGVIFGTRPIETLSQELSNRDGGNLAKINIPVSKELLPIKESVNRLLERVEGALHQEKAFSADLSHELRTPLAAIKIHAQNIELRENLSEESVHSLKRMIAGIDVMSKTIEQLLLLGKIEAESHSMMQEEVPLLSLLKNLFTILPSQLHQKNELELSGEDVSVLGSHALLTALFRNLIENASKYSDAGTAITISVAATGNQATVEIADSGPGMTDEQKVNSIKRHYRVSDTQSYGSGLGLAIALKIVELHKGSLTFKDPISGKGLIALVSIPKVHSPPSS